MSSELPVSALDTNILVYAHLDDAPHHDQSAALLSLARTEQQAFAVTPQILLEFHAVITDARRVSSPYTPTESREAVERLLNYPAMSLLPIPADVAEQTLLLAKVHTISGPAVFDAQIVATLLSNGVERIYTYDKTGFAPFVEIETLQPQ